VIVVFFTFISAFSHVKGGESSGSKKGRVQHVPAFLFQINDLPILSPRPESMDRRFSGFTVVMVACLCFATLTSAQKVTPNTYAPSSSVAHAGDAVLRAHTNYRIHSSAGVTDLQRGRGEVSRIDFPFSIKTHFQKGDVTL
jgi:hypothetical protein